MARRDLSPEDAELWRHVTRNVQPYHRQTRHATPEGPSTAELMTEPAPRAPSIAPREAPSRRPQPTPLVVGAAQDMDRRTARRFKRGELATDGRIDLHGLTLEQAHAALGGFIRREHGRGSRCVVVVTGKGHSKEHGGGEGKIRRETPHWLNQPALRSLVLAVTEARPHAGGTGAFYVLLKRRR
jgi:DNA-nicking Smr family endonuclease